MSKIKKVVFSVSVSPDHKKKFRDICRKENRPQSQMFEIIIDNWNTNINLEIKYYREGAVSLESALQNIKGFIENEMKRNASTKK